MKTLLALLLAALAAAPGALADGPPQYAQLGGPGVVGPNGNHYVAISIVRGRTTLETIGPDGSVWSWPSFPGTWGVPTLNYQQRGGLSRDGRTLFLQSTDTTVSTSFLVVDTKRMRLLRRIRLEGNFSFDALSPDASKLYLIQRVDSANFSRYVVRAYDLRKGMLLPGRIADRTQRSWVMQGDPMIRAESPDGRWAYTLYTNPGGTPFIHALDTVRGVAHCIGIPWHKVDQSGLWNLRLDVRGDSLAVHWLSGRRWLLVDRTTWRISPDSSRAFPWRWLVGGLLAAAAAALLARFRPRGTRLAPAA